MTIVAFGTSAPELVVNVIASLNGNGDLAFGNILGSNISNIFNLLWILGISTIINPLEVPSNAYFDVIFAAIATLVLFLCLYSRKKHKLTRFHGVMFLLLYIGYMITMFIR